MSVCDASQEAARRALRTGPLSSRASAALAAVLTTTSSSSALAFGLGDPGAGDGGGGPISGIAAALPSTDGVVAALVGAGVVLGLLWRHRGGGLWLAAAAVALMSALPLWAALSVWLVVFAGLRTTNRTQLAPAVVTGLVVFLTTVVGAAAVAPSLARVVAALLGLVASAPVELSGAVLTGPAGFVHVASACVGLEGMVVAFALSSAVALLSGARQGRAVLAGSAAAVVWFGLNVARIAGIFVLMQRDVEVAERAHDAAGLGLMAAHLLLCGMTWLAVRWAGAGSHRRVGDLPTRAHISPVSSRRTARSTNESILAGNTHPRLRTRSGIA
jgi:exosortase/archaeosortase family protein